MNLFTLSQSMNIPQIPLKETSRDYLLEPTQETPFVKFNGKQGVLLIKGNSLHKDILEFYEPVLELINSHLKNREKLTCYFFFKNFNQKTTRALFDIFELIKKYQTTKKKITINWFADWHNHEMIETGIDLSDMFELKVNIMPI